MGRCAHRSPTPALMAAAAALLLLAPPSEAQELLAGPAVSPAGAVVGAAAAAGAAARSTGAAGSHAAATAPPGAETSSTARPERRGSGGTRADRDLRRRLEDEERRSREVAERRHDELLRRLFRDTAPGGTRAGAGPGGPPLAGEGDEFGSPSACFLRAVRPPDWGRSVSDYRGFERFAARELSREWRRRYREDAVRRRSLGRTVWEHELNDEEVALSRDMQPEWKARWNAPFPAYWNGHAASAGRDPIVVGEELEVLRVGRLTVVNDGKIEYDLRSYFYAYRERGADPEEVRPTRARPAHAEVFAEEPTGNLVTTGLFTLDARARMSVSTGAGETGFVSRLGSEVDWIFYDAYDRRRLFAIELDGGWELDDADESIAVLFKLYNF